jgi:glycine/D-amino acid oxidase-like deaminating enzyme
MSSINYDVAIIGGGMVGASIAYHCAKLGMRTALVEKAQLAAAGSGGNFGLVLPSTARFDNPFVLQCEQDGVRRLENLSDELDFDFEYRPVHGYCLLCSEDEVNMFSIHRDHFVAAGFGERMITPRELQACEPNLHVGPETIAALQTDEAVVNPMRLTLGLARSAKQHGADLLCHTQVTGFKTNANRVTHLVTPDGDIGVGEVIISAGAWSRQLALMLDISLPEYYIQAEAVVTEPLPPLLNGFAYWGNVERIPKEIDIAKESITHGWESRGDELVFESYDFGTVQTQHGNILLGQLTYITPPFNWQVSHQVVPGSAYEAMRLLPQLKKARMLRSWRSPAPFTPDHMPLLGRLDGFDNLAIASGVPSAVSSCSWIGVFMADLIAGREVSEEMSIFSAGRFPQPVAV